MLKYILIYFFLATSMAHAQNILPIKYKDAIFPEVSITQNNSYATGEHPGTKDKHYLFNLYEPKSDVSDKRPLIIWLHGGGFKFGTKNAKGIRLWSETFAQRGYVCVALNYRMSKKNPLFNFIELKRGCYGAVQSVKEAVAFFKKNHALYRIDTTRIILAGNSAGGMIALQAVYSSDAELAASAQMPGAGQLSTQHNSAGIAAVINFWGGLYDIGWLQNTKVPVFSAYGTEDKVVPVDRKDTSLYGSISLHKRATELHIPNGIMAFEGYSHELQKHFNPIFDPGAATKQRWREAGQAAADFLYKELF